MIQIEITTEERETGVLAAEKLTAALQAMTDDGVVALRRAIDLNPVDKLGAKMLADLAATTDAVLVLQDTVSGLDQHLQKLAGVKQVEATRSDDDYPAYRITGETDADICPDIYELAREQQWPLRELRRDVQTLETVFNELATV